MKWIEMYENYFPVSDIKNIVPMTFFDGRSPAVSFELKEKQRHTFFHPDPTIVRSKIKSFLQHPSSTWLDLNEYEDLREEVAKIAKEVESKNTKSNTKKPKSKPKKDVD